MTLCRGSVARTPLGPACPRRHQPRSLSTRLDAHLRCLRNHTHPPDHARVPRRAPRPAPMGTGRWHGVAPWHGDVSQVTKRWGLGGGRGGHAPLPTSPKRSFCYATLYGSPPRPLNLRRPGAVGTRRRCGLGACAPFPKIGFQGLDGEPTLLRCVARGSDTARGVPLPLGRWLPCTP